MRITGKRRVTIPQAIRDKSGLLPHTEVEFDWSMARSFRNPPARCAATWHGDAAIDEARGTMIGFPGWTTE